ncbi:DNA polymerase III subunit epsilon [Cephaloticoccus capnophilus]|uniref:DNA polymerase III subunit epsilon n=1 Tax=Cephaloticoccus capnophilus TaxID=1548208 RepID=A0A139SLH8_9BACT|nr:DNA polymerase III subunit epsilon [Cephaloticoccus capnophilus]KXU35408.1 DNA polymerase III subunit epsilon [Cephaloticoccus capnophilus]
MSNWTAQPIHFVDFEGSLASGIVEYGVVTLIAGEVRELHTRLCAPRGRLRQADIAVHGLGEGELAGAAPVAEDFARFAAWRQSGPLAAHFAGTENTLLKSVWPYSRASPDFTRGGVGSGGAAGAAGACAEWGPWVDTGALYRQLYPQLGSYKLAELVSRCGLQAELDALAAQLCPSERCRYHAAPYDALAGALLLCALAHEPQVAALSTLQLLALSTLDGAKRDAIQQTSFL